MSRQFQRCVSSTGASSDPGHSSSDRLRPQQWAKKKGVKWRRPARSTAVTPEWPAGLPGEWEARGVGACENCPVVAGVSPWSWTDVGDLLGEALRRGWGLLDDRWPQAGSLVKASLAEGLDEDPAVPEALGAA